MTPSWALPGSGPRVNGDEILDRPDLEREALRTALAHVAGANAYIGGLRSLLRHLSPIVAGRSEFTILDVGTGNGQVARWLTNRMAREGTRLRWVGFDLHAGALSIAAEESAETAGLIGLVQGNACILPFGDRVFDLSIATLTLHHFPDNRCVSVLKEMARVSRLGVLVSDLERHPVHYLGARLLAATWWRRDPVTRHDAPLSVLRAFTPDELRRLGDRASFRTSSVRRHFPFRLVLEGRP